MADGWELDQAHVDELVRTNVIGVMACGTFALRRMVSQGSGAIVNITSGAHFGIPHMSVYGATKGAVASLTYTWSMEAAGSGVRVNAVSPLARTRMGEATAEFYRRHNLGTIDSSGSPDPEVNAPAVVFLLSDAASAINGQIVRIEGQNLAVVAHPAVREPVLRASGRWPDRRSLPGDARALHGAGRRGSAAACRVPQRRLGVLGRPGRGKPGSKPLRTLHGRAPGQQEHRAARIVRARKPTSGPPSHATGPAGRGTS